MIWRYTNKAYFTLGLLVEPHLPEIWNRSPTTHGVEQSQSGDRRCRTVELTRQLIRRWITKRNTPIASRIGRWTTYRIGDNVARSSRQCADAVNTQWGSGETDIALILYTLYCRIATWACFSTANQSHINVNGRLTPIKLRELISR